MGKFIVFYIGMGLIAITFMGFLVCLLIIAYIDNNKREEESNYEEPRLKELTEEQITDIHARGKITPAEKLKEWEGAGLCAPGDAIGSAAWRCHKFKNCHDCLVDYANAQDEYTSFYDDIKIICK